MTYFLKTLFKVFFAIFYRVEVKGLEYIPKEGGAILCCNHICALDPFLVGCKPQRLVHWMAKQELFKNPIVAKVLRKVGTFPINREKADIEALKIAIKCVKEGHILGIFPEGTRIRNKQRSDVEVKAGVGFIAVKAKSRIIPVAISGNYKPFGKIKLIYGKPFDMDYDRKYNSDELVKLSKDIMDKVYELME